MLGTPKDELKRIGVLDDGGRISPIYQGVLQNGDVETTILIAKREYQKTHNWESPGYGDETLGALAKEVRLIIE